MRKVLMALATTLFVTWGAQAQTVNINTLNTIVKGILDPIVAQDTFFEDLSLVFDPSTDLDNNYVGVEISAASRSLAWTQSLTSLNVGITFDMQEVARGESLARGNLTLSLNTDIYSFSQYVAATLQSINPCPAAYDMYADVYNMDFLLCDNLLQTFVAGDFQELKSNFANVLLNVETQLNALRATLQAEIGTQTDSDILDNLRMSLQNVDDYLQSVGALSVVETADEVVFTVDEQALNPSGSKDQWSLSLMLSETSLLVSLGYDHYHPTGSYDSYVQMVKNELVLLEQNDPDTVNYISSAAQSYLDFAKMFLTF
ncbi:MAG: hypothetical protein M9899_03505 [Bdellovibrionaceae bacterium]|nr:hypothetical protein [Pseudobdellovibrionaceae bacterium]